MVDPISITFLVGALVGSTIAGVGFLLWRVARGAQARHFPHNPSMPGPLDDADPGDPDRAEEFPIPTWLNCETNMNFAICGETNVGKSKLITLMCNLPQGAAASGPGATTVRPATFSFQAFGRSVPHVNVIDLPGAGTTDEPASGYIVRNGLRWMSSVLLVVGPAVRETDVDIVNRLIEFKVPIYVVRSMLDQVVKNAIADECERLDVEDLSPTQEHEVAAATLASERTRLLHELCSDKGIRLSPDTAKEVENRLFNVCGQKRGRAHLRAYGIRDDFDALTTAMWSDAVDSYSVRDGPDSDGRDRPEGEVFDEGNDNFAVLEDGAVHRRLLPAGEPPGHDFAVQ